MAEHRPDLEDVVPVSRFVLYRIDCGPVVLAPIPMVPLSSREVKHAFAVAWTTPN